MGRDRFKVGDRVQRLTDVYDPRSAMKHGTVTRRYSARSRWGRYPELYAVRWNDGTEQEGFLPHGLDKGA